MARRCKKFFELLITFFIVKLKLIHFILFWNSTIENLFTWTFFCGILYRVLMTLGHKILLAVDLLLQIWYDARFPHDSFAASPWGRNLMYIAHTCYCCHLPRAHTSSSQFISNSKFFSSKVSRAMQRHTHRHRLSDCTSDSWARYQRNCHVKPNGDASISSYQLASWYAEAHRHKVPLMEGGGAKEGLGKKRTWA